MESRHVVTLDEFPELVFRVSQAVVLDLVLQRTIGVAVCCELLHVVQKIFQNVLVSQEASVTKHASGFKCFFSVAFKDLLVQRMECGMK